MSAIGGVFTIGLAAMIGLLALMKSGSGFDPIILAAAMLSFLLTLVIEGVLVGLLLRSGKRGRKEAADAGRVPEPTTKELGEAQARALPDPLPSVTEHTTRTFEPLYAERKSKTSGAL